MFSSVSISYFPAKIFSVKNKNLIFSQEIFFVNIYIYHKKRWAYCKMDFIIYISTYNINFLFCSPICIFFKGGARQGLTVRHEYEKALHTNSDRVNTEYAEYY